MNFRRLIIAPLFVMALLLAIAGMYYASSAVMAQDKESTQTTDGSKTTPTGFATGTKCTKAGTYRAESKYLKLVITLEEGDAFPPFPDGQKTIWYPLTENTKESVEPIKVIPDTN